MHAIEQQIVDFLYNAFNAIGWLGVVAAMTIESICILLPSEVIMPLAGWMLVQAKGLSAWHVLWAAFYGGLGCTIAAIIIYWIGALGGRPLLEKYGKYVLISRHDMEVADKWFARYGEATAFFSRLLPVVRTLISLPLGMARMNFAKFTVLAFVGSFLWSGVLAYLGYVFGEHWVQVREAMRLFDIPILIALVGLVAWYVYTHVRRARTHEKPDAEPAA